MLVANRTSTRYLPTGVFRRGKLGIPTVRRIVSSSQWVPRSQINRIHAGILHTAVGAAEGVCGAEEVGATKGRSPRPPAGGMLSIFLPSFLAELNNKSAGS